MQETAGVYMADVVIVLLPGGRGTHVELGVALGVADAVVIGPEDEPSLRIVIYSPTPDKDFGDGGDTCAFYHHPFVETFDDFDEMVGSLIST